MEWHDVPSLFPTSQAGSTPWFRVYTLGRFQIDWVDPHSGQITPLPAEKMSGQNAGTALGLFKALLSCPNRFATRSWLLEQFWPNSRHSSAEDRLTDVVSSLRSILRPKDTTAMLVHFVHGTDGQGAGFRLDGFPQMWCDADAFEWYVKHALLLDQRGQDSSACWERAYLLAERGMYLPEQVYEEWARQKRDYLTGLLRDCVQRWTHLLRQMEHVDEAIMRLRSYWLTQPTEQDALRPLLEMLGERERFQEAEECYAKARAALTRDGYVPDERTIETIESVRALKIRRAHTGITNERQSFPDIAFSSLLPLQTLPSSSPTVLQCIMGTACVCGGQDIHSMIRRRFLQQLFGLVGMPFVLQAGLVPEPWSPRTVEAFLPQCEANILACWQLMRGREFLAVHSLLLTWLPPLDSLVSRSSLSRKKAANLAAQGYILAGLSAVLQEKVAEAEWCCRQAIEYSRVAEDTNLHIASLKHLATKYVDAHYPLLALRTYQEALPFVPQVSPLLQSRIYLGLALANAQCQQQQEAESYLGLAQETFPTSPETDPSFLYADCGRSSLNHYGGLIALAFHQPKKAWNIFEEVNLLKSTIIIPERTLLEIINCQADAAVEQHNLELACMHIQAGVTGALDLKSAKRLSDTYHVYQRMSQAWPFEPQVQRLEGLFHQTRTK